MNISAPIVHKFLELLSTFYLVSSDFQITMLVIQFDFWRKMSVRLATPIGCLRHPIKYLYTYQSC